MAVSFDHIGPSGLTKEGAESVVSGMVRDGLTKGKRKQLLSFILKSKVANLSEEARSVYLAEVNS